MVLLMDRAKLYVEGAGAVGVAALLAGAVALPAAGTTCVVLSGGNVDLGVVPGLIRRHETKAGRRLVVFAKIDDRPGGLVRLLAVFAGNGANLIEVEHVREGVNLSVRETGVHATFEVRGPEHAETVVDAARGGRLRGSSSRAVSRHGCRRVYLLVGRLSDAAMDDTDLLRDLEPTVEQLLERHLATSKEWFPHEHVPYSRGRDAVVGEQWSEDDADLGGATIDDAVRSALLVNLLTEDNLPYYFRSIEQMFGADGAWGTWVRRWTAEEGRHSMAIYGYLMDPRAIDPHHLERGRMAQVSGGMTPDPALGRQLRLPHAAGAGDPDRPPGDRQDDRRPGGYEVMMRVAADENLHQLFYRDLATAAIAASPNGMMARDRAPGRRLHDARHRHPRLRRPRRGDRPGGHLRPRRAPRADPRAGRAPPLGRRAARRPRRRGRAGPRAADGAPGQERAGRPPPRRAPRRSAHLRLTPARRARPRFNSDASPEGKEYVSDLCRRDLWTGGVTSVSAGSCVSARRNRNGGDFLPDKAIDLVDEAASKLRMEIDSMPAELDEINRRVMQLEIEREALRKEKDKASKERLDKLEKELADLKEQHTTLMARWQQEKEAIQRQRKLKEELEQLRLEIERAQRGG